MTSGLASMSTSRLNARTEFQVAHDLGPRLPLRVVQQRQIQIGLKERLRRRRHELLHVLHRNHAAHQPIDSGGSVLRAARSRRTRR